MKQPSKTRATRGTQILFGGLFVVLLTMFVVARVFGNFKYHRPHVPAQNPFTQPQAQARVVVGSAGQSIDATDMYEDGFPQFWRLSSPSDEAAFRGWFTALAEYEASKPTKELPAEISDCAGLLRFCYREALKKHNDSWFVETGFTATRLPGEIKKYHYPQSPLGAKLFRIKPGSYDAHTSATDFAEFADAKTLVQFNAYSVGRELRQAREGDLLFYRQFGQSSPWHSMIVVRIAPEDSHSSGLGVIYHTGPIGHGATAKPGEIRRVRIEELLDHPRAEWRPTTSNPNFLGIYRWKILRND